LLTLDVGAISEAATNSASSDELSLISPSSSTSPSSISSSSLLTLLLCSIFLLLVFEWDRLRESKVFGAEVLATFDDALAAEAANKGATASRGSSSPYVKSMLVPRYFAAVGRSVLHPLVAL